MIKFGIICLLFFSFNLTPRRIIRGVALNLNDVPILKQDNQVYFLKDSLIFTKTGNYSKPFRSWSEGIIGDSIDLVGFIYYDSIYTDFQSVILGDTCFYAGSIYSIQ